MRQLRKVFRRLVRQERGMALMLALGITTVLSLSVVSVIDYTAANARNATLSAKKTSVC